MIDGTFDGSLTGFKMPSAKGITYYRRTKDVRGRYPRRGIHLVLDVFRGGIDQRSLLAREIHHYNDSFLNALGGVENVSPQVKVLTERASVLVVKVKLMEAELLNGSKSFPDNVYLAYLNSLRRLLETVGLTRKAREMGVLEPIDPHVQAIQSLESEKQDNNRPNKLDWIKERKV